MNPFDFDDLLSQRILAVFKLAVAQSGFLDFRYETEVRSDIAFEEMRIDLFCDVFLYVNTPINMCVHTSSILKYITKAYISSVAFCKYIFFDISI